jgi:hypothetical protein
MTALAVVEPSKAKVAVMMHLTLPMLNIGGRQVSINPHGGSEGAKTSKKRLLAGEIQSSVLFPVPPVLSDQSV